MSVRRMRLLLGRSLLWLALLSCGPGKSGSSAADCPALRSDSDALDAQVSSEPGENGRLRAFLQASKDVNWAASRVEHLAATACRRIGADLGMQQSDMLPRKGPGGAALGACDPVAARIDAVMRQGIRPWVIVQPAQCQANMSAYQRCAGRCDVNTDPVCNASCRAHANVNAACQQAVVTVRQGHGGDQAATLIATLEANLPALVEAQTTVGQRVLNDAVAVAQAGKSMGSRDSDTGRACVGAGTEQASDAAIAIQLSVRASAGITSRVTGM
ncbi:MAG TPA: hypothetical protein VFB62_00985 [Polyangiaceae bacterium]|nr:hypothetical protein [Polyangiaceae bacterium]